MTENTETPPPSETPRQLVERLCEKEQDVHITVGGGAPSVKAVCEVGRRRRSMWRQDVGLRMTNRDYRKLEKKLLAEKPTYVIFDKNWSGQTITLKLRNGSFWEDNRKAIGMTHTTCDASVEEIHIWGSSRETIEGMRRIIGET